VSTSSVETSEQGRCKVVDLVGAPRDGRYDRLFAALQQLYPVRFRHADGGAPSGGDAAIVLNGDIAAGRAAAARGLATFVVVARDTQPPSIPVTEVRFGTSPLLDRHLCGEVVCEADRMSVHPLAASPGDTVLASTDGVPLWVAPSAQRGLLELVTLQPPILRDHEYLVEYFHGRRFLRLLPLMNFLRRLVERVDWQAPAQHACVVLDDPSLYWPTYGFVDYRRLAEHASHHDYCVAVATIPLDSWWVNRVVAEVFRSQRQRLSLVIHGNNHTKSEMLRQANGHSVQTAAQAIRRCERLEREQRLPIARIMEPPHGAIAEDMFAPLLSFGYEAALATSELLVNHNRQAAWPATIGLERASMLGGGLPVLPRIGATPFWKNDVLLSAFLRQPIAVTVHHQDAARDMDGLAEIARVVNRFGTVVWTDIPRMLRTNYVQRTVGDVLFVRMHSRAVAVHVPAGVTQMCIQRSWVADGSSERVVIASAGDILFDGPAGALTEPLAVAPGGMLDVRSERPNPRHFSSVAEPAVPVWAIARKMMMEARDRLTPALSRLGLGWDSTRTPAS